MTGEGKPLSDLRRRLSEEQRTFPQLDSGFVGKLMVWELP